MRSLSIITLATLLLTTLGVSSVAIAQSTSVGTIAVSATVLGSKPVVTSFTPTTGAHDATTSITKIVGYNFGTLAAHVYGVFLDDAAGTLLTGTLTLQTGCDIAGSNCGTGGQYSLITGLSVPTGVKAGIYNILVTTSAGTNIVSSSKFTVTAASATATPAITDVAPTIVSLMENLPDSVTMAATVADSDTAAVNFDVTGITVAGITASAGSPQASTSANAAGGQALSFVVGGNATAQVGSMTLRVGDGGSSTTGNTSTRDVSIFIEPGW